MSKQISVEEITKRGAETKFEQWLVKANENCLKDFLNNGFPENMWTPLSYSKGRNYAKIYDKDGSVWGFVAMKDINNKNMSFKEGDLLKAASYSSPAKHARGNIFEGTDHYYWTGPEYIR